MSDLHLRDARRRPALSDRWPPRRWIVVALAAPVLTWLMVTAAPVAPAAGRGGVWWVLVLATALAGSGTLASYVPASGRHPELGCSPCAALSVLTVLGAVLVLRGAGGDPEGPVLALAVALFGLGQRLAQPPACPSAR